MSSTNRGAKRIEADFYPTPAWATRALFSRLALAPGSPILDPCAGDGAILEVAKERGHVVCANELRKECLAPLTEICGSHVEFGDALGSPRYLWPPNAAVITNPPFSLFEAFIDAYVIDRQPPVAAMLLRLNCLGGQERAAWWHGHEPTAILVLPRRPAFVAVCKGRHLKAGTPNVKGCGNSFPVGTRGKCSCGGTICDGTDSCEYAWFVFDRRVNGLIGIHVIPLEDCK